MRLSAALQAVATVVGILFALGYVIVNARLQSYGVMDVAPLNARYVAVGLLFCVLVLIPLTVRRFLQLEQEDPAVRRSLPRSWPRGWRLNVLRAVAMLTTVAVELLLVIVVRDLALERVLWFAIALLVWNIVAFGAVAFLPIRFQGDRPLICLPERSIRSILGTTIGVTLAVLTVTTYAAGPFRYIPQWVGGGLAPIVRITLKEDVACPDCTNGQLLLLADSGDRLVLLVQPASGPPRVVEILADSITAIVHEQR